MTILDKEAQYLTILDNTFQGGTIHEKEVRVNVPRSWSSGFPLVGKLVGKQDEQEGQKLDNQSLVGGGCGGVYCLCDSEEERSNTKQNRVKRGAICWG